MENSPALLAVAGPIWRWAGASGSSKSGDGNLRQCLLWECSRAQSERKGVVNICMGPAEVIMEATSAFRGERERGGERVAVGGSIAPV